MEKKTARRFAIEMRHECTLMPFGVARNLYNTIKVYPEFSARLRKAARSGLSRYRVSKGAYIYPRRASLLLGNPIAPLVALRSSVRPS